jgi:biopolymer transport protein ExbD
METLRKAGQMGKLPAYLVALGVVVVAAAFVYTVVADRGPAGETQLAELQKSVDALRGDVAGLHVALNGLEAALRDEDGSAVKVPLPRVAGGTAAGATAVEGTDPAATVELDDMNTEPVDIVLTVAADGTYVLDGKAVAKEDLKAELDRTLHANPAMQLIVMSDTSTAYDDVATACETAKSVGIHRLHLSTEPAE